MYFLATAAASSETLPTSSVLSASAYQAVSHSPLLANICCLVDGLDDGHVHVKPIIDTSSHIPHHQRRAEYLYHAVVRLGIQYLLFPPSFSPNTARLSVSLPFTFILVPPVLFFSFTDFECSLFATS